MGRETGHGATDLLAVLEHGDPLDTKGGDPDFELVGLLEGDVPTWMWHAGRGGLWRSVRVVRVTARETRWWGWLTVHIGRNDEVVGVVGVVAGGEECCGSAFST